MKIAIASVNKNEDSQISSRGGRAPYYLIFNEKRELLETISNPFGTGGGGAGVGVAKMLADKNVNIVIAGVIGDKMADALSERNVKFHESQQNITEALDSLL